MKSSKLLYSIVIPIYKSGEWIDELVNRIDAVMKFEAPDNFELILVNDCSPDMITWRAIQRNAELFSWVRGFDLLYNVGQFRAIICGMQQARGRFIITMDDDFQNPPEELPKLFKAIQNKDVLCVIGKYDSKKHNLFRNMGSKLYQLLLNRFYGKPKDIQTTSFRIMRKELVDALLASRAARPHISALIFSITTNVENVTVLHSHRSQGQSGYTFKKLISTTFESIFNASTTPLRFFSITGFLISFASIIYSIILLLRWISGGISVAGYTSQVLLATFFGGMTLAGIGLLGEYIARIISEITGPELYRIRKTTDSETSSHS